MEIMIIGGRDHGKTVLLEFLSHEKIEAIEVLLKTKGMNFHLGTFQGLESLKCSLEDLAISTSRSTASPMT